MRKLTDYEIANLINYSGRVKMAGIQEGSAEVMVSLAIEVQILRGLASASARV